MAKRSTRGRGSKVTPAELTLKYLLPGDGSDVYLDLMRDISAVNRRGMPQGQMLRISHVTVRMDSAQQIHGLNTTIKTLPITWVAAQAYMKARNAWIHQQRLVSRQAGQEAIRPHYEDFKIYMDNGHRAGTTLGTLDGAGNAVVQGEWDYSKLVYADQTVDPEVVLEPHLHLVGADVLATDVGLINAYEDSRATVSPTQPNVPAAASDNIYTMLSAGQDDGATVEIVENMETENDNPPYSLAHYPGGVVNYPTNVDTSYLRNSSANPIVHSQSFTAMCGLLRVYSQGVDVTSGANVPVAATLLVHLVPGSSRGVLSMNVGDLV